MPEKREDDTLSFPMNRRQFLTTLLAGAAISVIGLTMDRSHIRARSDVLRPPGAISEDGFLSLCARCGRCIIACPTSALHLQGFENGLANFMTPQLVPAKAPCVMPVNGCHSCIETCPAEVLQPINIKDIRSNQLSRVLKMGTAILKTGRCIPYSLKQPCLACKEVCPVDDAITIMGEEEPRKPIFNIEICVGCGACEHACPTNPKAVSVSSTGAKRMKW